MFSWVEMTREELFKVMWLLVRTTDFVGFMKSRLLNQLLYCNLAVLVENPIRLGVFEKFGSD